MDFFHPRYILYSSSNSPEPFKKFFMEELEDQKTNWTEEKSVWSTVYKFQTDNACCFFDSDDGRCSNGKRGRTLWVLWVVFSAARVCVRPMMRPWAYKAHSPHL